MDNPQIDSEPLDPRSSRQRVRSACKPCKVCISRSNNFLSRLTSELRQGSPPETFMTLPHLLLICSQRSNADAEILTSRIGRSVVTEKILVLPVLDTTMNAIMLFQVGSVGSATKAPKDN
jgi:hypothetical protein